ncbi:uncharacterized protein [Typha angustifolia]|uniref:uncharacterized protein n=1 Tax=Typha angustifolia TaxID=59011 RepID=UPI003C2F4EFC
MASVAQKEEEEVPPTIKLELKLLVDQTSNRVLFAEAGKDVADFLLGLACLPLGYVTRLVGKQLLSNSISSLYSSLESFPDAYLVAPAIDRTALLNPNASSYSLVLLENKPKISVRKKFKIYYECRNNNGYMLLSEVAGRPCPHCQVAMSNKMNLLKDREEELVERAREEAGGGYVKGMVRYLVMDDLTVVPISIFSAIDLLNKLQVTDTSSLYESVVEVGMDEGLEILKASLQSKTVLTDVFLPKFEGGISIELVELGGDASTTNG